MIVSSQFKNAENSDLENDCLLLWMAFNAMEFPSGYAPNPLDAIDCNSARFRHRCPARVNSAQSELAMRRCRAVERFTPRGVANC